MSTLMLRINLVGLARNAGVVVLASTPVDLVNSLPATLIDPESIAAVRQGTRARQLGQGPNKRTISPPATP
ncbi:hypothetical protein Pa4123_82100 [Phytohabitans aurantiacus]|uniref:Uncharacterized protein n=1 Tax=Phytohabitans aurantiacus TaxID=3016789 RepID=A0ABQ5R9V8_9ACTN|nr:hypothetical protein Pa4123_82100 [Phytohabitans aurantiacus]